ncbi:hypothetical protein FRACYDRAFT_236612 [Fragilariopsis cylindrus CCMP1102]|uniref:Uncharacterized protein n=1 Tax=Fragilariopsis cylindrus CCMP1102 TaxID=635003 RepID=A0A1E7FJJ3_9STRA|nr:hypothetical protein FRACYDRAFT_236612 [Fragilariopsis cylindrus CCMP1102]|eukprot:OEU18336.1 hypothetical protein FRACYDRAFT_236612 [Fragilariopsis cylindrus CCMP1102]
MATTTAATTTSFATTAVQTITNNRYYIYLSESESDIISLTIELWNRLEVPSYTIYQTAWKECIMDLMKSLSSSYNLWYITLKPFVILISILIQNFYNLVLEYGGRSFAQKGILQTKYTILYLYHFQLSLNRTEIIGEIGLIFVCIGLYYFQRWLYQQTYWTRITSYTKEKKNRIIQSYTDAMYKVANVSKILAMALPHILFIGICVSIRIIVPDLIQYITYNTPVLMILSVWYPLISTFLWVQNQRDYCGSGSASTSNNSDGTIATTTTINNVSNEIASPPSQSVVSERKKAFENKNIKKKKSSSSSPNKKSKVSSASSSSAVPDAESTTADYDEFLGLFPMRTQEHNTKSITETESTTNAMATTNYWLNYWHMYAIIQAFGHCFTLIPFIGRFLTRHPVFHFFTGEFKLFFFCWVFGMERILGNMTKGDAFLAKALPLRLMKRHITPIVMSLHDLISDAVSKEVWDKWIVSKTKSILSVFVLVRMLSEEWKDWLLHVAEEVRVLTIPSITLLMPGFITQFGVTYVQYIIPATKSADAKGNGQKLIYLQYWILHCAVSGLVSYFDSVLWWIPFSSHLIFILWSYLILPQAIKKLYGIIEMELMAFGLLRKRNNSNNGNGSNGSGSNDTQPVVAIQDTKTVQFINSIVSRLPSAASNNVVDDDNNNKLMDNSSGEKDDDDDDDTDIGAAATTTTEESPVIIPVEKKENNHSGSSLPATGSGENVSKPDALSSPLSSAVVD